MYAGCCRLWRMVGCRPTGNPEYSEYLPSGSELFELLSTLNLCIPLYPSVSLVCIPLYSLYPFVSLVCIPLYPWSVFPSPPISVFLYPIPQQVLIHSHVDPVCGTRHYGGPNRHLHTGKLPVSTVSMPACQAHIVSPTPTALPQLKPPAPRVPVPGLSQFFQP